MSNFKLFDVANPRRLRIIVPLLFVVLLGGICSFWGKQNASRLYNNKAFAAGEIYDYTFVSKASGTKFFYRFSVGDKVYSIEQIVSRIAPKYGDVFVGKTFPVIYERDNPTNCELWLLPEQFKEINAQFPDSLKWVKKYL